MALGANPWRNNSGALHKTAYIGLSSLLAGGAEDNVTVTSAEIDRQGYDSAKIVIQSNRRLTAAKTFGVYIGLADCATSGGSYGAAVSKLASGTAIDTGLATWDTDIGTYEVDISLEASKQYIKIEYAPYLSHTSADIVEFGIVLELLGSDENPSTLSA